MRTETRARVQKTRRPCRTVAMSFSAYLPTFLTHKADSELGREEALHFARLLSKAPPEDISDEQTAPSLRLAQKVLGHLLEALDEATHKVEENESGVKSPEADTPNEPNETHDRSGVPDVENAGDLANVTSDTKIQSDGDARKRALAAEAEIERLRAELTQHFNVNKNLKAERDTARSDSMRLAQGLAGGSFSAASTDLVAAVSTAATGSATAGTPTTTTQQQTETIEAPSLDPSEAASAIAEAKALTASAHAAIKTEIDQRRAFANECASAVRAALDVNKQLESQLSEANKRRKAAEQITKQAVKNANDLERALEVRKAFYELRKKSERRRMGKNNNSNNESGEDEYDAMLTEVELELTSAALQCQRRRRGVLGRRSFIETRKGIIAEDKQEWAEEEAATKMQSMYRGFQARRDIRETKNAHSEETEVVHSLVQEVLDRVVEASKNQETDIENEVETLTREIIQRVVENNEV